MPKNASTGGPRTPAGKAQSRRNARKHGIFCSQITLSDAERTEFNELENSLRGADEPPGALADVLFDNFLAAAWHLRRAYRASNAALRAVNEEPARELHAESTAALPPSAMPSLRTRLKLLDDLQCRAGYFPPEMERPVTEAFGAEFWKQIADWDPIARQGVMIAANVIAGHEYMGVDLPSKFLPDAEQRAFDAFSRNELILKLTEMKRGHVLELHQANEKAAASTSDRGGGFELLARYLTAAQRNFYRALAEYEARLARRA